MKYARRILAVSLVLLLLCGAVSAHPFRDVKRGEWYEPYVEYVYENSLMNGMSPDAFVGTATMNRAMVVTVLHRMAGSPEPTSPAPFTDVVQDSFYAKSVAWAYENGIVMGLSATEFAPNANVLRCQIVTFFYRYAKAMGQDTSARADLMSYVDHGDIMPFAADAFSWAVAEGLISGISADTLSPNGTANRAQCAALLFRIDRLLKGETGAWLVLKEVPTLSLNGSYDAQFYYVGTGTLTWESSDPSVATVDSGRITPVSEGTATISVTDGTKKAATVVTVQEIVLKLDKSYVELSVGDTLTLNVTYTGNKTLSWMSNNATVASVDNGVVTALKDGVAYITVTDGDNNATCKFKVNGDVGTIEIVAPVKKFGVGKTYQFDVKTTGNVGTLTWTSLNEKVATVDQNGVVTTLAEGNGGIYVTDGKADAICDFRVEILAEEIVIRNTDGPFYNGVTRYRNDYVVVEAINKPNEATRNIVAKSSNNDVVEVSDTTVNGTSRDITLNFKSAGTATITLTSGDGAVSQSYTITVKDGYDFDPGDGQLTPEEFAEYTTKVMCANGFTYDIGCTSWRQLTLSEEELIFDRATELGQGMVHDWWPNGKRYCQIVYVGRDDNGDHVFHTYWAHG